MPNFNIISVATILAITFTSISISAKPKSVGDIVKAGVKLHTLYLYQPVHFSTTPSIDASLKSDESFLQKGRQLLIKSEQRPFNGPSSAIKGFGKSLGILPYSVLSQPIIIHTNRDYLTPVVYNDKPVPSGDLYISDFFRLSTDVPGFGSVGDLVWHIQAKPVEVETYDSVKLPPFLLIDGWFNAHTGEVRCHHFALMPSLVTEYTNWPIIINKSEKSSPTSKESHGQSIPDSSGYYLAPDFELSHLDENWLKEITKDFRIKNSHAAKDAVFKGGFHTLTSSEHIYTSDLVPLAVLKPGTKKHLSETTGEFLSKLTLADDDFTIVTYWRVRVQNSPTDPARGGGLTGEYWVNAHTGEVTTIFTRLDTPENDK